MDVDVEKVIREYLPNIGHMSLGTSKDNRPWVCEVHFAYDDDLNLYFRSLTSRRHSQEIASNPHVAGDIVTQHANGVYPAGIYFEGTAEELRSEADMDKAYQCIAKRFDHDEAILEDAKRPEGHHFYKIRVSDWYAFGKFGGERGMKYHLQWGKV